MAESKNKAPGENSPRMVLRRRRHQRKRIRDFLYEDYNESPEELEFDVDKIQEEPAAEEDLIEGFKIASLSSWDDRELQPKSKSTFLTTTDWHFFFPINTPPEGPHSKDRTQTRKRQLEDKDSASEEDSEAEGESEKKSVPGPRAHTRRTPARKRQRTSDSDMSDQHEGTDSSTRSSPERGASSRRLRITEEGPTPFKYSAPRNNFPQRQSTPDPESGELENEGAEALLGLAHLAWTAAASSSSPSATGRCAAQPTARTGPPPYSTVDTAAAVATTATSGASSFSSTARRPAWTASTSTSSGEPASPSPPAVQRKAGKQRGRERTKASMAGYDGIGGCTLAPSDALRTATADGDDGVSRVGQQRTLPAVKPPSLPPAPQRGPSYAGHSPAPQPRGKTWRRAATHAAIAYYIFYQQRHALLQALSPANAAYAQRFLLPFSLDPTYEARLVKERVEAERQRKPATIATAATTSTAPESEGLPELLSPPMAAAKRSAIPPLSVPLHHVASSSSGRTMKPGGGATLLPPTSTTSLASTPHALPATGFTREASDTARGAADLQQAQLHESRAPPSIEGQLNSAPSAVASAGAL